jgi:hypothetical protein
MYRYDLAAKSAAPDLRNPGFPQIDIQELHIFKESHFWFEKNAFL